MTKRDEIYYETHPDCVGWAYRGPDVGAGPITDERIVRALNAISTGVIVDSNDRAALEAAWRDCDPVFFDHTGVERGPLFPDETVAGHLAVNAALGERLAENVDSLREYLDDNKMIMDCKGRAPESVSAVILEIADYPEVDFNADLNWIIGYIQGIAEALDMTTLELFDAFKIRDQISPWCYYEDCDQDPGPDGLCDGHREDSALEERT